VLSIKTFLDEFLQNTGENFAGFLDSAFRILNEKKISRLIIDVRNNQGGNDGNGWLLYSYLTEKPFMYYASKETVSEIFSPKDHPELKIHQPHNNNYTGKVFILENGRSFSASAEFASILKTNQRGIFIGEECGGAYEGNTSGSENMVVLPCSQITVRIPLVKYTMAVKPLNPADRGVIPDFIFYQPITDIAEHTDVQLAYAISVVEKNK
jgi:C-terminal processing protease CtpA/Prc